MPRRSAPKSRAGCETCKRRHLKCNEERPVCGKCAFSNRECIYYRTASRPISLPSSSRRGPSRPVHRQTSTDVLATALSSLPPSFPGASNLDHIELFYRFITDTCTSIAIDTSQVELYRSIIVQRCFKQHFLLDQILALSACHMTLERPHAASHYLDIAANQQTAALAGYRDILTRVDASNCLDVLLFSHLIALQVFWEIFTPQQEADFGAFLERLVGWIRLLRGINLVITSWSEPLLRSDIGPIIMSSKVQQATPKESRGECSALREMLDGADLSASSIQICLASLDVLQNNFDNENMLDEPIASTHQAFNWLVTLSEPFTDLIDQRKPEALVLLSYYAVLLHRRRNSWAVADAGCRLLGQIHQYLGKRWDRWLEWPVSVIRATVNGVTDAH